MIDPVDPYLAATFLTHFETKRQLKDWIHVFLGLDLPDSYIDPDSNSSPIDWMFDTYQIYKKNEGSKAPSIIVVSSRESYKTLTESIWGIIAMVHFKATLAHMAAIVPQATAAQKYIQTFLRKIEKYTEYHGLVQTSSNAKEIVMKHPDNTDAYMKIIVCTLTGANSSHTNILSVDEIDTIRSAEGVRAYKEAQMIPGVFAGQFPLTIKTSTMKFPGGLFSKEMDLAKLKNWPVFKWNILDITEHCPSTRCLPENPKEARYVCRSLPLSTITPEEYSHLLEKEQENYQPVDLMKGCTTCSLAPVCQGRLHYRNPEDTGGLWKPIDFTISQFDKTDPDMAEAQLLCRKPSSAGMVYPRFVDKEDGTGNTYTLEQAWEAFTGEVLPPKKRISHDQLVKKMVENGVRFYCGVDWGFTHAFSISVGAMLPNKEFWIIDGYSVPGLEFEQMMDLAMTVRDKYRPHSWFCDTAQPMFIKAFKKNKMPCPKFTKDVLGGISTIRGQIINAKGFRSLKVIKSDRTAIALKMFAEHCFKLDTLGNVTQEPDDGEYADWADGLRYMGQNLFKPKGKNYVAQDHEPQQTPFTELTAAHLNTRPDPSSFVVDSDLLTDFGA
jgi:hypothetical protein